MMMAGVTLMIIGLTMVMLFLSLMVWVMHGTAAFFTRFAHLFSDVKPAESHLRRIIPDDSIEIAVAIAAVKRFRE